MEEIKTAYGTLQRGAREDLFRKVVDILETAASGFGDPFTIGLTGGSTPKAFYRWAVENDAVSEVVRKQAVWSVSDERMVPLSSEESNFGNADRQFLKPMGIAPERKFPWPVQVDPHSAARVFEQRFSERFGAGRAFDLCFLGMGDDGHTASIFPNSPLMAIESGNCFAPVEIDGKGWRLSITPQGLQACSRIVVMVTGEAKAERLHSVLNAEPGRYPIQLLAACAEKTHWLVDEEAGSRL